MKQVGPVSGQRVRSDNLRSGGDPPLEVGRDGDVRAGHRDAAIARGFERLDLLVDLGLGPTAHVFAASFAGAGISAEGDPSFPAVAVTPAMHGRTPAGGSTRRAAHAAPPEANELRYSSRSRRSTRRAPPILTEASSPRAIIAVTVERDRTSWRAT